MADRLDERAREHLGTTSDPDPRPVPRPDRPRVVPDPPRRPSRRAGTGPNSRSDRPPLPPPDLQAPPPPRPGDRLDGRADWRDPSGLTDRRPMRELPTAPPTVVAAVVAAAFVIGLGLQSRPASLATLIGSTVLAGVILTEPSRRRTTVVAALVLAVAAAGLATVRASTWVVGPALVVTVGGLVVGANDRLLTRAGWWRMTGRQLLDLVDTPRWLGRGMTPIGSDRTRQPAVARGVVLALAVGLPVAGLLASADAAFGRVLSSVFRPGFWTHVTVTGLVALPAGALALASRRVGRDDEPPDRTVRFGSMTEATIVLSSMAALLAAWGATQAAVALGGAERLLATTDLTAAENARQGFFQLVAVTAILIGLIAAVDRFTTRSTPAERLRFAVLTGVIGIETIGLVVAAYSRLALYIHGFGHTMLRTSTAWFLAWLALAMAVVVAAVNRTGRHGDRSSGDWAGAGAVLFASAGVWVIGFGLWNPEAFVADRNLDRALAAPATDDREIDLDDRYLLDELGPDAVGVLVAGTADLDPETADRFGGALCRSRPDDRAFGWFDWNRSVSRARAEIDRLDCDPA